MVHIPIQSLEDMVKMTCYDEDLIMNSVVGKKVIRARDMIGSGIAVTLDFKGTHAAKILLDAKCI